ncbi:MAG TPA: hypothetical protein VEZ40_06145, partial [Pyrinomonadaceae bacterium]|nr:hypothetical protein [Pyrinomonadaceae bacterium]
TLKSTTDSTDDPHVTYTVVLFDATGSKKDFFPISTMILPHTLGSTTTWNDIKIANATHSAPPAPGFYDAGQVDSKIVSGIGSGNPATVSEFGRVKMSVAPADPANPIVVGTNDPRLNPQTGFLLTSYGGKADGVLALNGRITAGTTAFSDPTANFPESIVGKKISVDFAGATATDAFGRSYRKPLIATITARPSPTTLTLSVAASNTTTAGGVNEQGGNIGSYVYGTDDTAAWTTLHAAVAAAGGGKIIVPGITLDSLPRTFTVPTTIEGTYTPDLGIFDNRTTNPAPYAFSAPWRTKGPKILYVGATTDYQQLVSGPVTVKWKDVIVDGNYLALNTVKADRLRDGGSTDAAFIRGVDRGFLLGSTSSLNDGSFGSTFSNTNFHANGKALELNHFGGGTTGAYFNRFYSTKYSFAEVGIDMLSGDNNSWDGVLSQNHRFNIFGALPFTSYGTDKSINIGTGVYGTNRLGTFNPYASYNNYWTGSIGIQKIYVAEGNKEAGYIRLDGANADVTPVLGGSGATLAHIDYDISAYSNVMPVGSKRAGTITSLQAVVGNIVSTQHVEITTSQAISPIDGGFYLVGADAGAIALTIPSAAVWHRTEITFLKADATANSVTITPTAGTINGAANYVLTASFKRVKLKAHSNGVWYIAENN